MRQSKKLWRIWSEFSVQTRRFGVFITLLGGILWGFSGACGQFLFEVKSIGADWLVPYRLVGAGFLLVLFHLLKSPSSAFAILFDFRLASAFIFYALVGLSLDQYFYFRAVELSNAAIATSIQYTSPIFVLLAVCLIQRRAPQKAEIIALFLAVLGVFLLATNGRLNLAVDLRAVLFAILSALCVVFYNLPAKGLIEKYSVSLLLGWGMLLGGFVLGIYFRAWNLPGVSDFSGVLAYLGVTILGTILAFIFYMKGLKIIGATRASMIAAIEPVSAAVIAYLWLGTTLAPLQIAGGALIVACIFLLAKGSR